MAESTFNSARAKLRIQRILDQLHIKPHTAVQLAQALHMGKTTAVLYLGQCLMKETPRRIYVHAWEYGETGAPKPVYALGAEKDAKKPKPQTVQEKRAKHWKKLKQDPERHQRHLNRRKADFLKSVTRCDPAAAWIHQARMSQA